MQDQNDLLEKVEVFTTKLVVEEFPIQLLYHNLKYIKRVVKATEEISLEEKLSASDILITKIAAWFMFLGFKDLDSLPRTDFVSFFEACNNCSVSIATKFMTEQEYEPELMAAVVATIKDGNLRSEEVRSIRGKILHDAISSDFSKGKGLNRMKTIYQQMLLLKLFKQGKSDFNADMIEYLQSHHYLTDYGVRVLEPKKLALIGKLLKEKKELGKSEDILVQRELDISQEELKALKKNLRSVQGRDDRGIQTMFRTTMRNHYTLNQMIDRKSNIMISINALIISVILGRIIGQNDIICIQNAPILIVLFFSVVSIVRAVLAIIPEEYHGRFTEEDVRKKKGNLLFFANFHSMKFSDYEWGMMEMMNDASFMYSSMIRDLYFLGQGLAKKYKHIRRSLQAFMIGIVLGVVAFLLVGGEVHIH